MRTITPILSLLLCLLPSGVVFGGEKAEFLPSIEDTIRIEEWQFLGPFSVGYREGIQSVIRDPAYLTPSSLPSPGKLAAGEYRSILAQGGLVTWKTAGVDSSGWVSIEFENVLWDTIMDIYGYAGLVNNTFAYAEVEAPSEARALVIAERIGTFYLNTKPHHGCPYGHDFVRVPVALKKGKNTIVLSLSGFTGHRFRFELVPAGAPVILLDDYTTPDLSEGETGIAYVGVTVLNTTGRHIDRALLTIGDGRTVRRGEFTLTRLAPMCVKKVPVEINVIAPPPNMEEATIPVSVTYVDEVYRDSLSLRVRKPGQSFKRTFISEIDGSCQYYAVLPPDDYDPAREYALILTLHGAGVRAEGQVDAYKPKSWAYVVAPTNRRPFGFDWQDWGRLDALEVLGLTKAAFRIDTSRVYLTGHSMGGHGVWHVGLNHPDIFAAMAPEAGWTSFELYIPWFLQKGYIYGDPRQAGMRDLALREDKPLNFVENAMSLPIFILHGGGDDNVPALHGRLFAQRLEDLGYEYEYREIPGRGHWWHDDSLDVSCVDYPEVMDFLASHVRNSDPSWVCLKTMNLGTANRSHWLEITSQEEPMKETFIAARALGCDSLDNRAISIEQTHNVNEFRLRCPGFFKRPGAIGVFVRGVRHDISLNPGEHVLFARRGEGFGPGPLNNPKPSKTASLYGPIKQAYFSPFIMVYGTQDSQSLTDLTLHQARLQAFDWWRRGNGYVDAIADTCVTDSIIARYNLILFGNHYSNSVLARIQRELPIQVDRQEIRIASRRLGGASAATFIYPNPLNPVRFVVVHAGIQGCQILSDYFKTIYAGAGLPDYIIFDESVRTKGWAGVICTGFFDNNWQVDSDLMFQAR